MKRSHIKSIMSNVLHSFCSRNNDYRGYWAMGMLKLYAVQNNIEVITLSLLKEEDEKVPILSYLSSYYTSFFESRCVKAGIPLDWIKVSKIVIEMYPHEDGFYAEFIVGDGHAKPRIVGAGRKCMPHNPIKEQRNITDSSPLPPYPYQMDILEKRPYKEYYRSELK